MSSRVSKSNFTSKGIAVFVMVFAILFAFFGLSSLLRTRFLQEQLILKTDVNQVFSRIEGGPLKIAQLHAAEIANEFLKFQFQEISNAGDGRFVSAAILGGKDGKESFGLWNSDTVVSKDCSKQFRKQVHPENAYYPFQIVLTVNTCLESAASKSIGGALIWIPIILCGVLLMILGGVVYGMLRSVRLADEVIAQNEDPEIALMRTEEIGWANVRALLKRAIATKGKNLQFFHALIRNTEHDASHIIRNLSDKMSDPALKRQISTLQTLLTRLRVEISQPTLPFDDRACFEVSVEEFVTLIKDLCPDCHIELSDIELTETVSVNDKLALERLILNLWTNAQKHGAGQLNATLRKQDDCLKFEVSNRLTLAARLRLKFAFLTNRIDVSSRSEPTIARYFGREGLGLTIAKQSALALGAEFFLSLRGKHLFTGFAIASAPLKLTIPKAVSEIEVAPKHPLNRVFCFASEELKQTVRELGLSAQLIARHEVQRAAGIQNIEIVSDEELNVPRGVRLKLVERKDRLFSLAKVWGYV